MSTIEPEPLVTNVSENIAAMDGYIQTDYDAAVQDARAISTRAAGLLAANAGVLTIAATIASSARDAGGLAKITVSIAAGAAVLSIVVAIGGALPRGWLAFSIADLRNSMTRAALEREPVEVRGSLVATRMEQLASLRRVIDQATPWLYGATVLLVAALIGLALTVGWVVVEPSRPAATHVIIDSPTLREAERDDHRGRRDRDSDGCRSQRVQHRHPVCDH